MSPWPHIFEHYEFKPDSNQLKECSQIPKEPKAEPILRVPRYNKPSNTPTPKAALQNITKRKQKREYK